MASIEILAGDLPAGSHRFGFGVLTVRDGSLMGENLILRDRIRSVMELNEEAFKRLSTVAAWAFVGALAVGPLGALGGALLAGKSREVTFAAELDDGRRFVAKTSAKTWEKALAPLGKEPGLFVVPT